MVLTDEQKKIIELRIKEHSHSRYEIDIVLDKENTLKGFVVEPNVHRPEKTSALYFARYLFSNNDTYKDKKVLDMGCGSGIQGIVMGLYGAETVTLSDVSKDAFENTLENIKKFKLTNKAVAVQSDLFENINSAFDLITFNHPFFPERPQEDIPITKAMLDEGSLIQRFLKEAPKYLNKEGLVLMPFFEFAGETNNPKIQGLQNGYEVQEVYNIKVDDENIQKGIFSVYKLIK